MNKIRFLIKDLWLMAGIVLILFMAAEFACFLAVVLHRPDMPLAELPLYKDFKAARSYWAEVGESWKGLLYEPYHLWRRQKFSGRYVNINENGIRFTYYNADPAIKGVKKIFMFGGSTLWGTGAPDRQTIPSYLAKILNGGSGRYYVRNYGETGFVSTQELNRLISEVKRGDIPDVAIFYDGINDASCGAGELFALNSPSYHGYMNDRFKLMFKRSKIVNLQEILKATYIYRAVDHVRFKLNPHPEWPWQKAPEREKTEAARLAAKYWLDNYRIASAVGREYGFKVIFLLQPNIYTGRKILQGYEAEMLEFRQDNQTAVYADIRGMIKLGGYPGVYDITDVFESVSEPVYVDWAHTGPLGNYYVADRISKILEDHDY